MLRKLLIIFAIIAAVALVPRPSQAIANLSPSILPTCDQTRYKLENKDPHIPEPLTAEVSPEEYGPNKIYSDTKWALVGYTVNENCDLNDFLQLFVNLFSWMLYIISILALVMLFVGGGTMLTSGGSEERVRTGKAIITNTIIGLAIALGSWLIINTLYVALLPTGSTKNGVAYILNNQPWFRTSASKTWGRCSEPPEYPCKGGPGVSIVRSVQDRLYTNGCYNNPGTRTEEVDGSFGPKTLAAWQLWQQVNGVSPTEALGDFEGFTISCTEAFLKAMP